MSRSTKKKRLTASEAVIHASSKGEFSGAKRVVYSIFFLFCFTSANLISISHYPKYKERLLKKFEPLAAITGLGQNWDLFSIPRKVNFHNSVVVSFKDGSTRLYEFPRVERFSTFEKFRRYKLRKFFYDYLPNPIGEKYRPSIAQFIAKGFFDPANPPRTISFDFNYASVPEPKSIADSGNSWGSKARHRNHSTIFVYRVRK